MLFSVKEGTKLSFFYEKSLSILTKMCIMDCRDRKKSEGDKNSNIFCIWSSSGKKAKGIEHIL